MAGDAVGGRVRLSAGRFMVYKTQEGGFRATRGRDVEPGAWFPAKADESLDYDNPTLCKLLQEITFDEKQGARDGTFRHVVVKRYFQDGRPGEVNENTEAAMHAEHLKGELVTGGMQESGRR